MNRCRAALSLMFALLLIFPVSGCGFIDIDKRFFVVGIGIDKSGNENKPYRVTIRLSIPNSKTEPGMERSQIETIDAKEISEGLRILKSRVDKELDLGHCKIFVLGKALARDNITNATEWMIRRRDIQSSAFVAIGYPDAESILHQMPLSERFSGNTLFLTFGGDGTKSSFIRPQKLFDLFRRINEQGMDPYLPVIQVTQNGYEVDRLALLDKQRVKLVLGPEQTQLFNQLDQQFINSTIKTNFHDRPVMIAVTDLRVHYKIKRLGSGEGKLSMHIHMGGSVEEGADNILTMHSKEVEKRLEQEVQKDTTVFLKRIQRANIDPLQFGLKYRATHGSRNAFQEWMEIYPNLQFDIKATVDIQGAGRIK